METLSIIFLVFSAASLEALNDIDCQDLGATDLFNNTCYKLFPEKMTWNIAQDHCATYVYHGILAEPLTAGQIQEVKNITVKYEQMIGIGNNVWLGASAITSTQNFTWKNSQVTLFRDSTWWSSGKPSNIPGENCTIFEKDPKSLNNVPCDLRNKPLCQTDIKNNCSEILPGALFASDYCLKYYEFSLTWEVAKSYCLQNNSHLAEPTTPDMIRTLTIYLRNINNVWIGATNENRTNSFYWETSGEPVNSEYMNLTDGLGQDRHLLWYNAKEYKVNWTDRPGHEEYGFVCQTAYIKRNASQYLAIVPKKLFRHDTKMYINVSSTNEFVVYVTFQLLDGGSPPALDERTLALSNQKAVHYELNFTISKSDSSSYFVEMKSTEPLIIGCYVKNQAERLRCSATPLPSQLFNSNNSIILISAVPEAPDYDITTAELTTARSTETIDDTTVQPLSTITSPSKTTENISKAEMDSMIHELQDQIKKELLVQYRNVSLFRRAKTTAEDKRTSSEVIGSVIGIGTIVFVFFLICIADVVACGYFLFKFLKSRCFPFKEARP